MTNGNVGIVHHHAFKCAGSTLAWILERNYPGNVLFIEGKGSGDRISCEQVRPYLASHRYQAVSSHLLAIPPLGGNIGDLHIALLRAPIDRVLSAYRFQKKTGDIGGDVSLEAYIETNFQAENFQAKHASMPHPATGIAGWGLDERVYRKIESGELQVGLVEYFDQSMLLLEAEARDRGIPFDGAYPRKINTTTSSGDPDPAGAALPDNLKALCAEKNAADSRLYETVKRRLLPAFSARFGESELRDFASRCQQLRADPSAVNVRVPGKKDWVHIEV